MHIVQFTKTFLLICYFSVVLSACNITRNMPVASALSSTPTPIVEVTDTPDLSHHEERSPLTAEDTKNALSPVKITLDNSGNLIGLPENTAQGVATEAAKKYSAIQKKFPSSDVYYAHDTATGQWLLFPTMGGNLYHYVRSYGSGPEQFGDYPVMYNQETDGSYVVTGDYTLVNIPGELSYIWVGTKNLPQLIAEKYTTSNGDIYYQEYMDYLTYFDQDPFKETPGVAAIVGEATPTAATPSVPENFLSEIPSGEQYEVLNGQVVVGGKVWFEQTENGEWRKSDWLLVADAPMQKFFGTVGYLEGGGTTHPVYPVLNGENMEVTKEVNGQPVTIKGRIGVVENPYKKGEVLKLLIPYRFEWGDGLSEDIYVVKDNEYVVSVSDFLNKPAGTQIYLNVEFGGYNKPTSGSGCGYQLKDGTWLCDAGSLSEDFFINRTLPSDKFLILPHTVIHI